jgi:hypothetical protein
VPVSEEEVYPVGYGANGPLGPVEERVQRGNILEDLWNRVGLTVEEQLRPGSKGYAKAEVKSGTLIPYSREMWLSDAKAARIREAAKGDVARVRGAKGRGKAAVGASKNESPAGGGGDSETVENQELKALRDALAKYSGKEGQLDLTPLLALTDSWTGSRMAQAYDKPMTEEERDQLVMGLRSKIAQHEDDIAYKRDYLKHQTALERMRLQEKAEENEKNRELRRDLTAIMSGGRSGKEQQRLKERDIRERSKYMRENRKALAYVAKALHPGAGEDDRSYETRIGPLNDEVYETARELEEVEGVPEGQGYGKALELYLAFANEKMTKKK